MVLYIWRTIGDHCISTVDDHWGAVYVWRTIEGLGMVLYV